MLAKINDKNSPNGIATQTPVTPYKIGKRINENALKIRFLNTEIVVHIFALLNAINILFAIMHAEANGMDNISIVIPNNDICANSSVLLGDI